MGLKLVDVCKALAQLDGLFGRDCPVNGSLYLLQRGLAAPVHKRRNIESLARMVKDVLGDGPGRLSKDITEDIIKLQVGDSQAVLGTVLLPDEHVGELGAVTHQVAELTDFRGGDKTWSYHVAHEKVTDPFGILAVGLVPFLGLGILGMRKGNKTGFLKDVENRDPVLAGGFHTDLKTRVFGKPVSQLPQTFGKGREAGLPILCEAVGIGDSDACIYPGLVDVKPTAVFTKDFKSQ